MSGVETHPTSNATQPAANGPSVRSRGPRLVSVLTNQRCNQACVFCDRRATTDDLRAIAGPALRARIAAALAGGAEEIRLTGGEPTMRADLAALVAHARQHGALRVSLETNATLIDAPRAAALAQAGLTTAFVHVLALDPRADAVTRDPGGAERTLAGLRALLANGIDVVVRTTLVASTEALIGDLPQQLAQLGTATLPKALELEVPVDGPQPDELLPVDAVVPVVEALQLACRRAAIPLAFVSDAAPPPCVFAGRGLPQLYGFTPGSRQRPGHTQIQACQQCLLADRCPGFARRYLERFGTPTLHPIADPKLRRRLTRQRAIHDQIAAELVSHSLSVRNGQTVRDEIVRINFHCNQACDFCFVSTHLPAASDQAVEAAIVAAGSRGARIVLSGGEPTLNPRLLDWIRLARAVSGHEVWIQTNAVKLDNRLLAQQVAEAGVTEAFVSLHGATPAVGDSVTGAPGTWERSLKGIRNLCDAGVHVTLNYVLCQANMHEFASFVALVAERFPEVEVNFSFVAASTDLVPREVALIPRYADMLPQLAKGLQAAEQLGVRIVGFESMCGLPLCLIPPPVDREQIHLLQIPPDADAGEFIKPQVCDGCKFRNGCWGMRRGYAALYGTDELHALPA